MLITDKQIFSSELVRLESRLQTLRDQREDLLSIYDNDFERCKMVPCDRALFDLASRLRIEHRIKTPDALHLAAALIAECDQFWTNDNHLAKAAGDKLEVWDWNRIKQAAKKMEQQ
jgi:predicted nucleic acid-binding protein